MKRGRWDIAPSRLHHDSTQRRNWDVITLYFGGTVCVGGFTFWRFSNSHINCFLFWIFVNHICPTHIFRVSFFGGKINPTFVLRISNRLKPRTVDRSDVSTLGTSKSDVPKQKLPQHSHTCSTLASREFEYSFATARWWKPWPRNTWRSGRVIFLWENRRTNIWSFELAPE